MLFKKKTYELEKSEIKKIIELKDTHWKYGLQEQRKWFDKNIKNEDIHLFKLNKKKIYAYVVFRKVYLFIKNKKRRGYLRDTLIINKKLNFFDLFNFLKESNKIIKKKTSVLFCPKNLIKLNLILGWKKHKLIKNFNLKNKQLNCMVFNLKNKELIAKIELFNKNL